MSETQLLRAVEALLFAAAEPLDETAIAARLPPGTEVAPILARLAADYEGRGIELKRVAGRWMFRTAGDLAPFLRDERTAPRALTRAQLEVLSIIAYHQPVTRADIEDVRGVATAKEILNALMETGWVRMRGRRRTPGRPITWGTTPAFLVQFGLDTIADLPGMDELKGAGLFDGRLPPGVGIPVPSDDAALGPDEDPIGGDEPPEDPGEDESDASPATGGA